MLSAGALTEAISDGKTDYTASVPFANQQITVTPNLTDGDADYAFLAPHDTDANSGIGGHQIDLALGANTFKVEVTAQDGLTKLTYTVVATRAYPELTFTSAQTQVAEDDDMSFTVTRNGSTSGDDRVHADRDAASGQRRAGGGRYGCEEPGDRLGTRLGHAHGGDRGR